MNEERPEVNPEVDPGAQSPDPGQSAPERSPLRLWFRDLLISVAASFMMIMFVYQQVRVEGTSMLPDLRNEDHLFINKFIYHFASISRGDVVVFHYPLDPSTSYIKRVIALPGDTLRIDEGRVYVNGKRIAEPYVPLRYRDVRSVPKMVVPPNEYYVLGDH